MFKREVVLAENFLDDLTTINNADGHPVGPTSSAEINNL